MCIKVPSWVVIIMIMIMIIFADKARDFIGKGHLGGEQQGKRTQENSSAVWLAVSGFMAMGLVSGWSLANHSNSESFLVAHASLSQDG